MPPLSKIIIAWYVHKTPSLPLTHTWGLGKTVARLHFLHKSAHGATANHTTCLYER